MISSLPTSTYCSLLILKYDEWLDDCFGVKIFWFSTLFKKELHETEYYYGSDTPSSIIFSESFYYYDYSSLFIIWINYYGFSGYLWNAIPFIP